MRTESEGCRLETTTAENCTEEHALAQQKQTGKAEQEVEENCDSNKNLKERNSAMEQCEEKTKSSSHDSQEGD